MPFWVIFWKLGSIILASSPRFLPILLLKGSSKYLSQCSSTMGGIKVVLLKVVVTHDYTISLIFLLIFIIFFYSLFDFFIYFLTFSMCQLVSSESYITFWKKDEILSFLYKILWNVHVEWFAQMDFCHQLMHTYIFNVNELRYKRVS